MIIASGILVLFFLAGYYTRNVKSAGKTGLTDIIVSLATSLATVSLFDLCPYGNSYYAMDESVFIYIARMMRKGYVPYRDMFDHKGPYLFFFELIGDLEGDTGIWILELIFAFVTSLLILKISKLITDNAAARYCTLFAVLFIGGIDLFEGGNYTEFWALPFICHSLLIFTRFLKTKEYRIADILFVGVDFAVVFLLQPNLVNVWIVFVPVTVISLIANRRAKEIFKCALFILAGIIITLIPVLIYFGMNGALDDLIECYWRFNFIYSGDSLTVKNLFKVILFLSYKIIPLVILFILSIIPGIKDKIFRINLIFVIVTYITSSVSGREYAHYAVTILPCFIIPLSLLFDRLYKTGIKIGKPMALITCVLASAGTIALIFMNTVYAVITQPKTEPAIITYLKSTTAAEDDVLVINGYGIFNLLSDRYTTQKYFYQHPLEVYSAYYDEFFDSIGDNKPDVILFVESRETFAQQKKDAEEHNVRSYIVAIDGFCSDSSSGYVLDDQGKFFAYRLRSSS